MLVANLYETLHRVLPNVTIWLLKCLENFLHDKVAFFLDLKVLLHVRDTVNKCLHGQLTKGRDFLVVRYITGQSQHH